jgi:ATP-dependent Clp protease protease subunit
MIKSSKKPKQDFCLPPNRILTLGEIDHDSINEVIGAIEEINYIDKDIKKEKREAIKIIINSDGGNVYQGFGLIDCMDNSNTPIHTICYGSALSMGFAILVSGHTRYAGKRATFMYHEISYEIPYSKISTHKMEAEEGNRMMDIYDNIILERTNITIKQLNSIKKQNKDWYFDSNEALKYNVIDKIL